MLTRGTEVGPGCNYRVSPLGGAKRSPECLNVAVEQLGNLFIKTFRKYNVRYYVLLNMCINLKAKLRKSDHFFYGFYAILCKVWGPQGKLHLRSSLVFKWKEVNTDPAAYRH